MLNVRVLDRFAWADEVELHAPPIGPFIEHLAFELRSMIHRDRQRQPAQIRKPLEHSNDAFPGERGIDLEHQTLAAEVIDDRKASQPSAIAQTIAD